MKTFLISFYHEFRCLGADCPHTCCKGWQIPVDEMTLKRYQMMRGAYGRALRFHVHEGSLPVIIKLLGTCPHYNSDRHCQFQENGHPELMPKICRVFPRDGVVGAGECEVTMELSCIAMARIFLDHPERLSFHETDLDIEPTWEMENDDPDFYDFLKKDREKILDFIWEDGAELSERFAALYAYVYREHDLIARDRLDELDTVELTTDRDEMGIYDLNREPTYAFFSIPTIDRMILNHINYGTLYLREPKFFRLIRRYFKLFSGKYVGEADLFFDRKVREMMADGYGEKYRAYFSYMIQQLYLKAYETYFVLRQLLFAILYVQLLMMFDLVDYLERKGPAPLERQAEILMLCEQGIRHNPTLTKNLLAIIREEFL